MLLGIRLCLVFAGGVRLLWLVLSLWLVGPLWLVRLFRPFCLRVLLGRIGRLGFLGLLTAVP